MIYVELEGEGSLIFTPSRSLFDLTGTIKQGPVELEVEMAQLTDDDMMGAKIQYTALFGVMHFVTFYGFQRHLRFCIQSESYAKQTSLAFLGMNACIDLFLSLWHMRLALYYYNCFDYLMLTSMMCLVVFIVVQSKLGYVVWRAQSQTVVNMVSCR